MAQVSLILKKQWRLTSQQKKTGTGLGLPIVTKIINEHSGNFSIKNQKGKSGALITITLPKYA